MNSLNKFLKIVMIFCALLLLYTMLTSPKTDCQVCSLDYEGRTIDGYEAFKIFEDACITYNKPWDNEIELPLDALFTE